MKSRIIWMVVAGLFIAVSFFLIGEFVNNPEGKGPVVNSRSVTSASSEAKRWTPISFLNLSEYTQNDQRQLRITGIAEPKSLIVLRNRGEDLHQIRSDEAGDWVTTLDVNEQAMVIEAVMFIEDNDVSIRAEETIFRIPVPSSENIPAAEFITPALIMVSAPGAPSRIIQSPFGGAPAVASLSLAAIDYDDAGGVIFSGATTGKGRIRLYAGGQAIGETRIGIDGRWTFIAGKMLPLGEYIVRADLIRPDGNRTQLSLPFERLAPLPVSGKGGEGAMSINFEPYRWQIRRTLIGGGVQNTVVFSPRIVLPKADEVKEK